MYSCTKCGVGTNIKVWVTIEEGLCPSCYGKFLDDKKEQENDKPTVDGSNVAGSD